MPISLHHWKQRSSDLDLMIRTFATHLGALDQVRILDAPSFDHLGRTFAILLGVNDASIDLAKHRQGVQIEHPGCFVNVTSPRSAHSPSA